jgi:cell wall-associated NlpC family hydrolase
MATARDSLIQRTSKLTRTLLLLVTTAASAMASAATPLDELASQLRVGDLVFIHVGFKPFREVATATGSWTNHVGIVVAADSHGVQVAEATVPWSRRGSLQRFVARSEGGRVAVRRLAQPLTEAQIQQVDAAARRREGVLYDTGFDLHSPRQFCSRFVHEVLRDATGHTVGEVQTFHHLLQQQPGTELGFWRAWYLGQIPWQRHTVTPASVLQSPLLQTVFDGNVMSSGAA